MSVDLFIDFAKEQVIHGIRNWDESFSISRGPVLRFKDSETGKVVGQIVVEIVDNDVDNEAWFYFFAIDPTIRGAGLGTRLLAAAEKYCKDIGIETIKLHPQKEFEGRLVPWYEKLGYVKTTRDERNGEWKMFKKIQELN